MKGILRKIHNKNVVWHFGADISQFELPAILPRDEREWNDWHLVEFDIGCGCGLIHPHHKMGCEAKDNSNAVAIIK